MATMIRQVRAEFPFSVVVGVELTQASGYALEQAERIARRIAGSQLHAVHVVPKDPGDARRRELLALLRLYVSEKVSAIDHTEGQMVGVHLRVGVPQTEVAAVAADVHAELILVGTHLPPHLKTAFVGSVSERLMRIARCPVLVVGPPPRREEHIEPEIEPTCPDCLSQRFETRGEDWWCVQHGILHDYERVHSGFSLRTRTTPARAQGGS